MPAPLPSSVGVFLWGMPGAGKSFAAVRLARLLGWSSVDLDAELECKTGQSIAGIFLSRGESGFRELEAETLREIVAQGSRFILACGGGTPCFHGNDAWMKRSGLTVYLDCPEELLVERLAGSTHRPLLADSGEDRAVRIARMLEQRSSVYQGAHLTISVSGDPDWLLALAGLILQWAAGNSAS